MRCVSGGRSNPEVGLTASKHAPRRLLILSVTLTYLKCDCEYSREALLISTPARRGNGSVLIMCPPEEPNSRTEVVFPGIRCIKMSPLNLPPNLFISLWYVQYFLLYTFSLLLFTFPSSISLIARTGWITTSISGPRRCGRADSRVRV